MRSIAVEVDHHVDAVDLLLEIALHALLGARHRRRLRVAERDRQAFGRGEDPGFGRQRGRLAVERLDLAEVGDVPGVLPFLGVDAAVDRDCRGRRCQQARS